MIQDAEEAGVSPAEMEELRDYLWEIKQGKLKKTTQTRPMYEEVQSPQKIKSDGGREVRLSTGPIVTSDFEDVKFKQVIRPTQVKEA
ncbi:MAG: hypothetical protein GDA56_12415 [Hormoscilla sp. GM7CHS1pb]|nr:hypothetical protein [Hormoscilla sp. GM7CHS1pb]